MNLITDWRDETFRLKANLSLVRPIGDLSERVSQQTVDKTVKS